MDAFRFVRRLTTCRRSLLAAGLDQGRERRGAAFRCRRDRNWRRRRARDGWCGTATRPGSSARTLAWTTPTGVLEGRSSRPTSTTSRRWMRNGNKITTMADRMAFTTAAVQHYVLHALPTASTTCNWPDIETQPSHLARSEKRHCVPRDTMQTSQSRSSAMDLRRPPHCPGADDFAVILGLYLSQRKIPLQASSDSMISCQD